MLVEVNKMKKKTINSELVYLFAIIILSFSIDLMTIANMGLSAINGPAYILSKKMLTFSKNVTKNEEGFY